MYLSHPPNKIMQIVLHNGQDEASSISQWKTGYWKPCKRRDQENREPEMEPQG